MEKEALLVWGSHCFQNEQQLWIAVASKSVLVHSTRGTNSFSPFSARRGRMQCANSKQTVFLHLENKWQLFIYFSQFANSILLLHCSCRSMTRTRSWSKARSRSKWRSRSRSRSKCRRRSRLNSKSKSSIIATSSTNFIRSTGVNKEAAKDIQLLHSKLIDSWAQGQQASGSGFLLWWDWASSRVRARLRRKKWNIIM